METTNQMDTNNLMTFLMDTTNLMTFLMETVKSTVFLMDTDNPLAFLMETVRSTVFLMETVRSLDTTTLVAFIRRIEHVHNKGINFIISNIVYNNYRLYIFKQLVRNQIYFVVEQVTF